MSNKTKWNKDQSDLHAIYAPKLGSDPIEEVALRGGMAEKAVIMTHEGLAIWNHLQENTYRRVIREEMPAIVRQAVDDKLAEMFEAITGAIQSFAARHNINVELEQKNSEQITDWPGEITKLESILGQMKSLTAEASQEDVTVDTPTPRVLRLVEVAGLHRLDKPIPSVSTPPEQDKPGGSLSKGLSAYNQAQLEQSRKEAEAVAKFLQTNGPSKLTTLVESCTDVKWGQANGKYSKINRLMQIDSRIVKGTRGLYKYLSDV